MAIKVGIPVSLTGQFRLQGGQTLSGIRCWADDVNRSGGMTVGRHTVPVEIIWHDDESLRDKVRAVTDHLIMADRVNLLVGPYSAVLTNAAAEIAQSRRRLMWNQGGASPVVYQRGNPWIVGILTPADEYLAGLLPAAQEAWPARYSSAVALLRAATGAFPRDVIRGVERGAEAAGFRIVMSQQFDVGNEDFGEFVQRVSRSAPDVLVAVGRFRNDLDLAEQLAEAAPSVGVVAVVAAGVDAFRERLGNCAENFVGPSQWEPDAGYDIDYGPSVEEVQGSLRRAGHPVIDYPMAQAYAIGVAIQRCVEECGSLEDGELRKAASSLDFTTFYGRFCVDTETGRPTDKTALLVQWQQGRKVIVWPPEHRNGRLVRPWRE